VRVISIRRTVNAQRIPRANRRQPHGYAELFPNPGSSPTVSPRATMRAWVALFTHGAERSSAAVAEMEVGGRRRARVGLSALRVLYAGVPTHEMQLGVNESCTRAPALERAVTPKAEPRMARFA